MLVREVLVSLPSGAGVVCRDDGSVLVAGDVREGDGCCVHGADRFHPVKFAIDEERCVVGGLLPPGAVSAEAVDDRGARVPTATANGAYIAVLEQPDDGSEPIVCCRDAAGHQVRRPAAAEYPSVPVSDTQVPCPACGALEFEEIRPFEAWRGGEVRPDGTTVPTPVVRCRVCGHEEGEAIVVRASDSPTTAQKPPTRAEVIARARVMRREHMWRAVALGVQAQAFPIYGAIGWPAQLSGCGSEDDGRLTQVTVRHYETEDADPSTGAQPRLAITTKRDDPLDEGPLGEARWMLRGWARPEGIPDRPHNGSEAATALWTAVRQRAHHAAALEAAQSQHAITIDDQTATALVLTASADRWVAVAVRDKLTIIVAGHEVELDSLRLAPIADPAQAFAPPFEEAAPPTPPACR